MWHRILLIGRVFFILALSAIMEKLNAASMLPVGPNFLEHVHALPARTQEVVTHGVRHGAASTLATAHLHLDTDLRAVEPGFPLELQVQRASYDFSIGFGSFKIHVSPPFQRRHKFLSFFCPFLRIPFCSVGGPQTDGEIYPRKNLIFGKNFAPRRAVPPTHNEN